MEQKTYELKKELANCYILCNYCFNACLKEQDVKMMVRCIKLDRECAMVCSLTLALVASDSEFKRDIVDMCARFCDECGRECRKHDNDHCRECAEACEKCAEACRNYIS